MSIVMAMKVSLSGFCFCYDTHKQLQNIGSYKSKWHDLGLVSGKCKVAEIIKIFGI